jgi:hypothetical protein
MKKGQQETVWCGQTETYLICDNRYIFFLRIKNKSF